MSGWKRRAKGKRVARRRWKKVWQRNLAYPRSSWFWTSSPARRTWPCWRCAPSSPGCPWLSQGWKKTPDMISDAVKMQNLDTYWGLKCCNKAKASSKNSILKGETIHLLRKPWKYSSFRDVIMAIVNSYSIWDKYFLALETVQWLAIRIRDIRACTYFHWKLKLNLFGLVFNSRL